jgi:8-oxo-dGTP diphosphatase
LKGYWSLPGGVLETGETLEEGIQREVLEETGLVVVADGIAKVFERIMRDDDQQVEYHYVLIDYFCKVTGGSLQPGDDCANVHWFRVVDLPQLLLTEGTLSVIEEAYETYQRRSARV